MYHQPGSVTGLAAIQHIARYFNAKPRRRPVREGDESPTIGAVRGRRDEPGQYNLAQYEASQLPMPAVPTTGQRMRHQEPGQRPRFPDPVPSAVKPRLLILAVEAFRVDLQQHVHAVP